jgi:PncC family amidohydrolase
MAQGVQRLSDADYAVSVTGIAGPGGGSKEKPVGTVYVGVAHPEGTEVYLFHFSGNRDEIR